MSGYHRNADNLDMSCQCAKSLSVNKLLAADGRFHALSMCVNDHRDGDKRYQMYSRLIDRDIMTMLFNVHERADPLNVEKGGRTVNQAPSRSPSSAAARLMFSVAQ